MTEKKIIWHRVRLKAIHPDNETPSWIECQMSFEKNIDILKEFKNYCKICYEPLANYTFELISID